MEKREPSALLELSLALDRCTWDAGDAGNAGRPHHPQGVGGSARVGFHPTPGGREGRG